MTAKAKRHDRAGAASVQWRRERPDLDPFPMELVGRLCEVAEIVLKERLAPLFAAHGLQRGEFDVLATLRRAGAPYALTPTDLYETAMVSSGGMTARIDRLEKMGLVERRPHPTDRRGTLVALTGEGRGLLDKILPLHIDNERSLLASLDAGEQQALSGLLAKLLAGLEPA